MFQNKEPLKVGDVVFIEQSSKPELPNGEQWVWTREEHQMRVKQKTQRSEVTPCEIEWVKEDLESGRTLVRCKEGNSEGPLSKTVGRVKSSVTSKFKSIFRKRDNGQEGQEEVKVSSDVKYGDVIKR